MFPIYNMGTLPLTKYMGTFYMWGTTSVLLSTVVSMSHYSQYLHSALPIQHEINITFVKNIK
jgi:hypothetical protein